MVVNQILKIASYCHPCLDIVVRDPHQSISFKYDHNRRTHITWLYESLSNWDHTDPHRTFQNLQNDVLLELFRIFALGWLGAFLIHCIFFLVLKQPGYFS